MKVRVCLVDICSVHPARLVCCDPFVVFMINKKELNKNKKKKEKIEFIITGFEDNDT